MLTGTFKRGDWASATIYLGLAVKRVMEMTFLLNQQYYPYAKWLHRLFLKLPHLTDKIAPLLEKAIQNGDWLIKVESLVQINRIFALDLHERGLCSKPHFGEIDPSLTEVILYQSTAEIYKQIPPKIVHLEINETEHWENLVRNTVLKV